MVKASFQIKKERSHVCRENALNIQKIILDHSDISSRRAFWALLDIKGYPIAVVEGFKTGRIDCAMMYKYIRSVFLFDESKTFVVIKPLNSSICHNIILLSKNFNVTN